MTSAFFAAIPAIFAPVDQQDYYCIADPIHVSLYAICSVLLVTSSLWVRLIRNRHEEAIVKQQICFGVEQERLTMLQKLSASIVDIIKLNFVTAALLILSEVIRSLLVFNVLKKAGHLVTLLGLLKLLYFVSNPVVYILSMGGLKREYRGVIHQFLLTNRVKSEHS